MSTKLAGNHQSETKTHTCLILELRRENLLKLNAEIALSMDRQSLDAFSTFFTGSIFQTFKKVQSAIKTTKFATNV